ncbi:unnamed protein product [Aureobasidium mustum]|uniref:Uncharacterized protein n=1 Tax=Aureobasidium mustum TaxID=2773714 RepID=A0A9N8K450_9PEZI|nr:unnamed protein product [Aureobasidium mustum]
MVVKWSSEKDQFILCHILEDKNIKISTEVLDSMIAAWRNTPLAAAKPKKTPAGKAKGSAKRKKAHIESDSEDYDEAPPTKTPAKRRKNVSAAEDSEDDMEKEVAELGGVKVKNEPMDEDEDSPSNKKSARRAKEQVQYAESDDGDVSHPEDADEYVDKEVVAHMTAYLESPDSGDEGAEV